eukprot:148862-Rhodomonas_salina.2
MARSDTLSEPTVPAARWPEDRDCVTRTVTVTVTVSLPVNHHDDATLATVTVTVDSAESESVEEPGTRVGEPEAPGLPLRGPRAAAGPPGLLLQRSWIRWTNFATLGMRG